MSSEKTCIIISLARPDGLGGWIVPPPEEQRIVSLEISFMDMFDDVGIANSIKKCIQVLKQDVETNEDKVNSDVGAEE